MKEQEKQSSKRGSDSEKENISMDEILNELNEACPQLIDVINDKLESCAIEQVPDPKENEDSHENKLEFCVPEGAKPLDKQCISIELAALLNSKTTSKVTRGQAIKRIWNYIHEHNLQDPKEPAYIIPDDKMAAVFGEERFDGFTMAIYLERHYKRKYLTTFDMECEPEGRAPLDKQCLSHELRNLINVDKGTKLIRGQVVKRVWDYIDEHDLKDPKNPRYVIPDEKMSAVVGENRIVGFTMTIQLENHYKREHMKVNPTFVGTPSFGEENLNIVKEENDEENNPSTASLWEQFSDFWKNTIAKDKDGEDKSTGGKDI